MLSNCLPLTQKLPTMSKACLNDLTKQFKLSLTGRWLVDCSGHVMRR